MTLSHGEFIRRFLLHVLPTGFVRIRYFGFMGQAVKSGKLQLCRMLLGALPPEPEESDIADNDGEAIMEVMPENGRWFRCPLCKNGHLVPYREIPRPYHRNVELAAVV